MFLCLHCFSSKETRTKIGTGVREGWRRRHKRLSVQENCLYEWNNLIAEASRKGNAGEKELQCDSYDTLDKQLMEEWLESVEKRKIMRMSKGSRRGPKSPEQRMKISEAISAKWADPVCKSSLFYVIGCIIFSFQGFYIMYLANI